MYRRSREREYLLIIQKVKLFKDNWDHVELQLIKKYNKQINCFDEFGTLKYEKFVDLVKRNNVYDKWERTF